ncbi:hypothetical protein AVEN_45625-1 [Araneus ventricosus]|uniref:Uncharacterized protein n=1 Tax=Araneus ventricosus TaxID=182803 RepID=A0A4Y2ETR4_ARAVE|nr:hypothetical protein AVEN_45625-1 [Araneus ventricosus]
MRTMIPYPNLGLAFPQPQNVNVFCMYKTSLRWHLLTATSHLCDIQFASPQGAFEYHEGFFGTDLVVLNRVRRRGQHLDLAPPSPSFHTTSAGGRLIHEVGLSVQQDHMHGGSSGESGFEPGTLQPRSRDLTA